jgi:hypothetical protein
VTAEPEAHPVCVEYVVERALSDGRWVVDSPAPALTAEQAVADVAWLKRPHATYRTVRRTITSTVVAVHPGKQGDRS